MTGGQGPAPAGPTPRVLLVGMMGAGKTTTGQGVAARLGWTYLDSDVEVQRETGRTVPELFRERGEAVFRAAEARVLDEALQRPEPVVVSVAGGAVLNADTRELVRRSGTVVWLRCEPETLARRVGDGAGRPLLDGDPAAAVASLYAVRRPLYAEVADVVVDVDRLTPDQVVDRVVAAVRGAGGADAPEPGADAPEPGADAPEPGADAGPTAAPRGEGAP